MNEKCADCGTPVKRKFMSDKSQKHFFCKHCNGKRNGYNRVLPHRIRDGLRLLFENKLNPYSRAVIRMKTVEARKIQPDFKPSSWFSYHNKRLVW